MGCEWNSAGEVGSECNSVFTDQLSFEVQRLTICITEATIVMCEFICVYQSTASLLTGLQGFGMAYQKTALIFLVFHFLSVVYVLAF